LISNQELLKTVGESLPHKSYFFGAANSSVIKCLLPNWKVGCTIHSHWVNCHSAPWARVFTSTVPARSTIQASACRQLPSPKIKKSYFGKFVDIQAKYPLHPKKLLASTLTIC